MNSWRRLAVLLAVLGVACTPAEPAALTEAERVAIADTVSTLLGQTFAAANAADADGVMAHVEAGAMFPYGEQGRLSVPRDSFEALVRRGYAGLRSQAAEFTTNETMVLDRDIAMTYGVGPWSQTDTAGVVSPRRALVTTTLWRRGTDGWRMFAAHQSYADTAIAPTP